MVPRGPVADACWENTEPCPTWKAANAAKSDFRYYADAGTLSLCYDTRILDAELVTAGTETSVTPEVDYSTLQGVRCISESLMTGISHCTELTYEAAQAYCLSYVDSNGISDYRLPLTSYEAGRVCGTGTCGYDTASPTWETDPTIDGLPSTVAGVWVDPEYMVPQGPVADVCWETATPCS